MMSNKINISETFKAIRQLPLEISYQQVEQWVRATPSAKVQKNTLGHWLTRWFLN